MFARPDYFLSSGSATCTGSCVTQNTGFAWDHGDYAAEIDTNYLGIAGPGVKHLGLDGDTASQGPSSAGPDSGQITVPGSGTTGTWLDETDIRPTLLYLTGLKDDYQTDGRVITQVLTHASARPAPGRGHRARRLLQAAELQRRGVRHGDAAGRHQGRRERQRRRHHLHPHRPRAVRPGAGPRPPRRGDQG